MGQRLNIEVCYDGEPIANAYYHWSAYTNGALDLLEQVITAYKNRTEINSLRAAVEILQATQAGVDAEEKKRISADMTGSFKNISFKDCIDRNTGILSVTEKGMAETRMWEEGRVTVDIGTEEFIFDVTHRMSEKEYDEYNGPGSAQQLSDIYFDITEPCRFIDFEKFKKAIEDNPNGVWLDEDDVLCWIE